MNHSHSYEAWERILLTKCFLLFSVLCVTARRARARPHTVISGRKAGRAVLQNIFSRAVLSYIRHGWRDEQSSCHSFFDRNAQVRRHS